MRRYAGVTILGMLLAVLIGVFLGISAWTFNFAEGASYMSNKPEACVNCHIMRDQFDAWQKMPHHASATCNDCHVPHDTIGKYLTKVQHGYRHSKAFTFQDFHEPIQITPADRRIVETNCVRCHGEFVSEITANTDTSADNVSCSRCHSDVGHGPKR